MSPLSRQIRWFVWFVLALIVAAVVVDAARAHHVSSRPSDARLAKLYPKLVKPGFKWGSLRARWTRTHSAAVREHVLPYEREFECIARHESTSTWNINTGNGYYGGLQMDRDFQRTYAPGLYARKGTANNWTRAEQIRTAARAVPRRGFHPWPNTARTCGLLR